MAATNGRRPAQGVITYYRDRYVRVTSQAIQVDGEVVPFRELTRVWYRRDHPSLLVLARRGGLGLSLMAPAVIAVIGLIVAISLDASLSVRVLIGAASILVGLGTALVLDPILDQVDASFDRGLHQHEIWIERNGVKLCLLHTRDAARFGRIYRALERAVDS